MRNLISSLLILLGLAFGVVAASIVNPVLGLAAACVALVALGALTYDRKSAT